MSLKGCEIMDFYTETFVFPEELLLTKSNALGTPVAWIKLIGEEAFYI